MSNDKILDSEGDPFIYRIKSGNFHGFWQGHSLTQWEDRGIFLAWREIESVNQRLGESRKTKVNDRRFPHIQ